MSQHNCSSYATLVDPYRFGKAHWSSHPSIPQSAVSPGEWLRNIFTTGNLAIGELWGKKKGNKNNSASCLILVRCEDGPESHGDEKLDQGLRRNFPFPFSFLTTNETACKIA